MLTLDEAIKHCEEVAERLENSCKRDWMGEDDEKCANEHRQLAEWLRELKDYREHEFCRYCEERDTIIFDEPCKSCKIRFVRKEVNADED